MKGGKERGGVLAWGGMKVGLRAQREKISMDQGTELL